jgi:hypothetical protein
MITQRMLSNLDKVKTIARRGGRYGWTWPKTWVKCRSQGLFDVGDFDHAYRIAQAEFNKGRIQKGLYPVDLI